MTKKGPFFGPQNVKKAGAQKWASTVQASTRSCCWSNQLQLEINASIDLPQWRGQNWTLQGAPLLISTGSTFRPLFKYVSFVRGSKTRPSTDWIRCLLGGPVLSPPKHLLQLRCSMFHVETHETNTELAIRASNKGGPNSVSKKHINFRCQKRTQN